MIVIAQRVGVDKVEPNPPLGVSIYLSDGNVIKLGRCEKLARNLGYDTSEFIKKAPHDRNYLALANEIETRLKKYGISIVAE